MWRRSVFLCRYILPQWLQWKLLALPLSLLGITNWRADVLLVNSFLQLLSMSITPLSARRKNHVNIVQSEPISYITVMLSLLKQLCYHYCIKWLPTYPEYKTHFTSALKSDCTLQFVGIAGLFITSPIKYECILWSGVSYSAENTLSAIVSCKLQFKNYTTL
jgi:hypothetical protein